MTTLLSEEDITIERLIYSSKIIINSNSRIGLVGTNGCGKTTLLNYISNHPSLVNYDKHIVDQHIIYESDNQTVLDYMLQTNMSIYNINKKILELESESVFNIEQYQNLIETPEYAAYDKYQSDCKRILSGLSITDYDSLISTYSGGWRMKLSIARSLIISPSILMMDEPTNHLDLNAIIWLGNYLNTYSKCLIIISHQIEFINSFSNQIWYIGAPDYKLPKLYIIDGKYDKLQKTITQLNTKANSDYSRLESKITEARSKNKSKKDIQKLITDSNIPRPPKKYEIKINFPSVERINSASIVKFSDVNFSYNNDNKNKQILIDCDLNISLDDRIVIVGSNGVGKTTLFKLIKREIVPTSGSIISDSRIKIAYYSQQIIENLPLDQTPLEYLQNIDRTLSVENCRKILSKVGLFKTDILDPCIITIDKLSGGQKARVSLCKIFVTKPDIILLDEPTNHLDIETIEGLIEGINEYEGGIILITHDIYLINSINNIRVMELNNGKLINLNNGIDQYMNRFI